MANSSVLKGIGVGRGAVVGPVVRANPIPNAPSPAPAPADPQAAVAQLTQALESVTTELQARADAASGTLADVLSAAVEMARDPELLAMSVAKVQQGTDPAVAITEVTDTYADAFQAAGGYLAERVTDLHSVRDRVVAKLLGLPEPGVPALTQPSIIVAADLSPADAGALDLTKVLGIVLENSGPTSHTAIIAGQLGLPCLVRTAGAQNLPDGAVVALDAARGTLTISPDAATLASVAARQKTLAALAQDQADGVTADGHAVELLANIGTDADAAKLQGQGAAGVGLFRTEMLFLDAQAEPTVARQAAAYARAFAAVAPGKVVIRTIDAGADKQVAFATLAGETNPALGVRAYRLVRHNPDLLKHQLEAIAAAAQETGTEPWVMAPMIATTAEAREFSQLCHAAGINQVGVMIEIPSAAIMAPEILSEVDFVSLGTNDLAQYTMAADRLAGELADLLDIWQPGVLFLVNRTAQAGLAAGKPVGVCGESAGDPLMALVLVGMGATSLSMSPAALPAVRFALRHHTLPECQAMAQAALRAGSAQAAHAAALSLVRPEVVSALGLD